MFHGCAFDRVGYEKSLREMGAVGVLAPTKHEWFEYPYAFRESRKEEFYFGANVTDESNAYEVDAGMHAQR